MGKRIGIVGTGFIAMKHLAAFEAQKEAEIVGMCTFSNMEKLDQVCREHQITPFRSLDEMLEKGDLDAVILCSVTACHYKEILKAAAAGVSILAEKPVVGETEQYHRVRRIIEQNRVGLFPGHNFIYRSPLTQMKKLLDEKVLGTILLSSFFSAQLLETDGLSNWRMRKSLSCGGALIDSGHHMIYQMLYLLGVPARLQCFAANLRLHELEGEDTAQLNMQMTDGSLCVITESWASDVGEELNGIRILGTEGEMHLTDALYLNGKKLCKAETYDQTFVNQAQAFLAYLNGEGEPLSTLEDSEHTLQIIRAAYRSASEGSVYRTKWHK